VSRSKKEVQPHWRPNFVNPAGLPDITVIRTDFIINAVAVVLMLLAGFYVLQRAYRSYSLGKTIADMRQQIRVAEGDDSMNLRLSAQFREAAATVAELEKFFASPVIAHVFLAEISNLKPEDLIFNKISFTESLQKQGSKTVVVYRVNISGNVRSLTVLDEFKGELSSWDALGVKGYALEIDEALQGRDAETGIFPYTLEITLRPEKGPAVEGEGS